MTLGIGVDVVEIARLAAALERTPPLREKLFTPAERELPLESLAARFAAKEALAKALGAPPGLEWQDAEILRGEGGEPVLTWRGTVAARAAALGATRAQVSLSHDGGVAIAMVLIS